MTQLYELSLKKLELNLVLEKLATHAGSQEGKLACLSITPSADLEDVRQALLDTKHAFDISVNNGFPSFLELKDIRAHLDRANLGGCLNPSELLQIAGVLRCARTVKSYLDNDASLASYAVALADNPYLEDSIFRAIIDDGEIADSASSELADIRRHMRIQSEKIKSSLQKIISSATYSKYLQEQIITIRQGRYVVPVKSEHKNDIPGMVHDVSSTGSTYFIEPMAAVSANNALRELELQEKKEIERILTQFTTDVSRFSGELQLNQATLTKLDVLFAKARLADKMNGTMPSVNIDGIVDLKKARHPLLDPKKAVPISVRLGSDFDTMVITGPNTGGKTVTLKTVGLLTLMAECGMLIPAGEDSKISVFRSILADIGDEQSIAQSLSTFSSHMRTIVDIIHQCDDQSLILFDELGAGTDPTEGAALAISLIEYCRCLGCKIVATTHYAELKLYAMRTAGVINASCEFDVESLCPTYRLLIGVPGKSNAFAISKKLGLTDDILKKASDLVNQNDRDFEDLLNQLENQRKQMESARAEAERLRKETEDIKEQNQTIQQELEVARAKALESARQEARRIIEDARIAANAAAEEIKAIKKQLSENANTDGINQRQSALRRSLNDAEGKIASGQVQKDRPKPTRDIIIGDTVELIKLGTKASVLAVNKDGTYLLQAGVLKLNAKPTEVYLIETNQANTVKAPRPKHSGREMKMEAFPSEVDLRGMDSIEAVCVLERYLDEAMRSNCSSVRIIHGKGTGTLRTAVHQALRKNKYIKTFRLGVYGEGEDGVTIAEF